MRVCCLLVLGCLLACRLAVAQEAELFDSPTDVTPVAVARSEACCACPAGLQDYCSFWSGWFIGLGGSYNSVKVDQNFNGVGVSDVYDGGMLVATGTASGPAPPFRETMTTFAPVAQLGYFHTTESSSWSWGAKFTYKYLGLTLDDENFDAPQTGSFVTTSSPPTTTDFTGNAYTLSAQFTVNNELALMPMIGRTFSKGRIYLAGGPVVFDTQTRMYGLYSYADINGQHTDIGGPPLNLAASKWMWGGAWQAGLVYYLRPACFLDVNYDFAVTGNNTTTWPVNTTSTTGSETYVTQIEYLVEQRIWAQSLNVTFNWLF